MLDHPVKTLLLMAKLQDELPFRAYLPKKSILFLRKSGCPLPPSSEILVSDLSYFGDEGGIMCHVDLPANKFGSKPEGSLILSLTHISVHPNASFSRDVVAYQKHRVKKLKKAAHLDRKSSPDYSHKWHSVRGGGFL